MKIILFKLKKIKKKIVEKKKDISKKEHKSVTQG